SAGAILPPSTYASEQVSERTRYFEGANTLRLDRKFNDWLLGSAGYLYSKLDADSGFNLITMTLPGFPSPGDQRWNVPQITLEKESHVANLNGLFGPWDGLVISTGVQGELTREEGMGGGMIIQGPPFTPNPAFLSSDYDLSSVQGTVGLRYSGIPFTSLFADAQVEEQRIGQSESLSAERNVDKGVLSQDTAFTSQWTDFRAGFNTSPWRSVSFTADYHRNQDQSWYNNDPLLQPPGFHDGYPGFLSARDILTEEVETKLALRLTARLKTTLSYQYRTTGYAETTEPFIDSGIIYSPGGGLGSGRDRENIYSLNTTYSPTARLFLSGTFSYQRSVAESANANSPSIVPYRGDIYSVIANAVYNLNAATDVFAGVTYAAANYGQLQSTALPLGLEYTEENVQVGITRRFGKNISSKLQYRYGSYDDPSLGGAANYRAHAVFLTMTYRMN
ncbi:MAG TPA: hypothetical protein VHB20_17355, partial [Verrucomicrobiae bacterium]|nr:hypothetical protein [Verrucomicrobiae bacterium]